MAKKKTTLSRDKINQASDIEYEYVDVPEWGGTARVRGLTGTERDAYEASLVSIKHTRGKKGGGGMPELTPHMKDARARLVSLCLVDDDDNRLYTDDQVGELAIKSGKALDRVYEVGCRLSGLTNEDMEELAGN